MKQSRVSHSIKAHAAPGFGRLKFQIHRAGAVAHNCSVAEKSGGIRNEPIHFLSSDYETSIDVSGHQPIGGDGESVQVGAGITDEGVVDGGCSEQCGEVTGG